MSNPMAILAAENVTKVFGRPPTQIEVLRGVSLSVAKGELVGIVGPSGSGKSTLLHLLGGVDVPTSGHVQIEGINLASLSQDQRAILRRRRIGFVFQKINLLPTLTALENVVLPLMLDGVGKDERNARAADLLSMMGMSHREKSFPVTLSGGEQQRVAIARALVTRPAVILADEPTGALDSANGRRITTLLQKLVKEHNQTVIIVTHDLQIASQTDRRVTVLDGKIVPESDNVLVSSISSDGLYEEA